MHFKPRNAHDLCTFFQNLEIFCSVFSSRNMAPNNLKASDEFSYVIADYVCASTSCDRWDTRIAAPRRTQILCVCWASAVSCRHCRNVDNSNRDYPRLPDYCWLPSAVGRFAFSRWRCYRGKHSLDFRSLLFPLLSPSSIGSPPSVADTSSGTDSTIRLRHLASTSGLENTQESQ